MNHLLFPVSLFALSGLAFSQVTPIGPFTGDRSDSFETQSHSGFQICLQGRLFNSTADLCTTTGGASINVTSSWGFMCSINPHSGSRFLASAGPPVVITFDTDVAAFGCYMGTNAWTVGSNEMVTVRFFNRQGGMIDSVIANVTDNCTWTWNGWSAPGIASIEIENSVFGGGFVDIDSLEVIDSLGAGGTFCNSNPNSTGVEASLAGVGSTSLGANNLMLSTTQMPSNSFAFYLASLTPGMTPNPGGSQGILCLGGSIGRFVGPGQIQNSGTAGAVGLAIDLTSIPQPNGAVSAAVGDTWHFQTWYRDANPSTTSNFSSGLEVTVTP